MATKTLWLRLACQRLGDLWEAESYDDFMSQLQELYRACRNDKQRERLSRVVRKLTGDGAGQLARVPEYLPTLEEIQAECEAIQAGWSRRERRSRTACKPVRFTIPQARRVR